MNPLCENFEICRLVCAKDFKIEPSDKANYIKTYCTAGQDNWSKCNRYVTKSQLDFCPDFVLPDTNYTNQQVLDKFDEGAN
jgi:hypothetical protein